VNNTTLEGPNGLPMITGDIQIVGAGTGATIIQRDPLGPILRIFQVASAGQLSLERLTIQNGRLLTESFSGAAILNLGSTTLTNTIVRNNSHQVGSSFGSAIRNLGSLSLFDTLVEGNLCRGIQGGSSNNGLPVIGPHMVIFRSTFRGNRASTGVAIMTNSGPSLIVDSAITNNEAIGGEGVAVLSQTGAGMTFLNTTIAGNTGAGAGTSLGGGLHFVNCTIADNKGSLIGAGGIWNASNEIAFVEIQNTILARNSVVSGSSTVPSDCAGSVASLGNNLVGTYAGCAIILFTNDRVGDPGIGVFTDLRQAADGRPFGLGHVPLLAGSQAIDAGDPGTCETLDQLGFPRADGDLNGAVRCDIGAIEFQPNYRGRSR
jgi:hypothetical protein